MITGYAIESVVRHYAFPMLTAHEGGLLLFLARAIAMRFANPAEVRMNRSWEERTSLTRSEVHRIAALRGFSGTRLTDRTLEALASYGLVILDGEGDAARISLPNVTDACTVCSAKKNNYSRGWEKRRATGSPPEGATASAPPAEAKEGVNGSVIGLRIRISANDSDVTPVVTSILCKSGRIADITQGYLNQLTAQFPLIDVRALIEDVATHYLNNANVRVPAHNLRRIIVSRLERATNEKGSGQGASQTRGARSSTSSAGAGGRTDALSLDA